MDARSAGYLVDCWVDWTDTRTVGSTVASMVGSTVGMMVEPRAAN